MGYFEIIDTHCGEQNYRFAQKRNRKPKPPVSHMRLSPSMLFIHPLSDCIATKAHRLNEAQISSFPYVVFIPPRSGKNHLHYYAKEPFTTNDRAKLKKDS